MKLYVNEKLFSIHNKYYVKDENNNDIFEISSKVISIGDKTYVKDLNGNVLAYIEQKIFHLMPNYDIYINNDLKCSISKKFRLFKNDYALSNNYRVEGNFLSLNFSIYNDQNIKIGEISRKLISIGDKYTIDIYDEKELILILAIIVSIANDIDRAQASSNSSSNIN